MALELDEKIDFKIKIKEKISVYPITVQLTLGKEEDEAFAQFKEEQDKKNKVFQDATDRSKELSKRIIRLAEDIEDLSEELSIEKDNDTRGKLRRARKKQRGTLRSLEDELSELNKKHDVASYQKAIDDLLEATAKKSFELNVEKNDKCEALVSAIEKYNIKYVMVVSELGRLVTEAEKKKKKRS